jgi:hypothetical protein
MSINSTPTASSLKAFRAAFLDLKAPAIPSGNSFKVIAAN